MDDKTKFMTAYLVFHNDIMNELEYLDWNVVIEKQIEQLEKLGCKNFNIVINNK